MKSFKDEEWVIYFNPGHKWHLLHFRATQSKYTPDSYRLNFGDREVLADISELRHVSETSKLMQAEYDKLDSDFSRNNRQTGLYKGLGSSAED